MSNLVEMAEAERNAEAEIKQAMHPVQALYHRALDVDINFKDIVNINEWAHDYLAHGLSKYDAEDAEELKQLIKDLIVEADAIEAYVEYMRTAEEA